MFSILTPVLGKTFVKTAMHYDFLFVGIYTETYILLENLYVRLVVESNGKNFIKVQSRKLLKVRVQLICRPTTTYKEKILN